MAEYTKLDEVMSEHNDIPIFLRLQTREDVAPVPFDTLSWRPQRPTSSTYRQSYWMRVDGFWNIPVSIALQLLESANDRGMLDERYDDQQVRHRGTNNRVIDSRRLGYQERIRHFDSVADREIENWGQEPVFVIVEVPDGSWRKTLIVDSDKEFCTFRSTTAVTDYGRKSYRATLSEGWILDNAMQDASAAMMREFLRVLREL